MAGAVLVQLAVVDRIVFPGGAGPSVVLLAVAAMALASGSLTGMLAGFCGGLALDVAPPAGHLIGQYALAYCLVGYGCGLLATGATGEGLQEQEHSALFELAVTAAGAVCGEVLIAGIGMMLSDPRVTAAAVGHVLPVVTGYDVLLSPFVLFAVAAMMRLAAPRAARAATSPSARRAAWAAGPAAAGAVRKLNGSGSPRLRLAGGGTPPARPAPARREPKLNLGRTVSPARSARPAVQWGASLLGGSVFAKYKTDKPLVPRTLPARVPSLRLGKGGGSAVTAKKRAAVKTAHVKFRAAGSRSALSSAGGTRAAVHAPKFRTKAGAAGPLASLTRMLGGSKPRRPGRGWIRPARPASRLRSTSPARLRLSNKQRTRTLRRGRPGRWRANPWRQGGGYL